MENYPFYTAVLFGITALITLTLFARSTKNPGSTMQIAVVWIILQSALAFSAFYTVTDGLPPRFIFLIGPPLLCILLLFITRKGRAYMDAFDLRKLTILHTIRIPVEFVLYVLAVHHYIPDLMTFEGRNYDILSGISAPIIYFIAFRSDKPNRTLLITWNIICLILLFNIVINAAVSVPGPLQLQAFNEPNIAILYAPFNLLPALVVPLVFLSHLISLRLLIRRAK